eukprot:1158434-Pelagomonas_calceolata.AAC.8
MMHSLPKHVTARIFMPLCGNFLYPFHRWNRESFKAPTREQGSRACPVWKPSANSTYLHASPRNACLNLPQAHSADATDFDNTLHRTRGADGGVGPSGKGKHQSWSWAAFAAGFIQG